MRSGLELAGRYRLEAPVGRGCMGEVWRGLDLRLRRPVAVKILPLSGAADEAGVARFRREAEIAAALNHPGITTVFDIDEHTDGGLRMLFLVMELMQGRDLVSVLREHPGGLPIAQVRDWAVQILDALSAAHRHGVVHRDIKPANLFLTDDARVKVCDFGIARLADATKITVTGSVAGTPLYMAPEQIDGRTVDERTDLYAFGCVLYQLLTGTTWVDSGSSVGAILHQHLNQTPASPRSVRPDIDEHLSALVLDLLAKQPDDRPKDAATVAERLRDVSDWPTSPDRPPTEPPRAPRHVAAHLGGVIHVGGVVVAAGCFIAANFLPIWSEYWTDGASGAQMAQATFTFNLVHPLARQIPTGPGATSMAPVWTWWLAPVLGLGTAVMLALAVLFPLLLRSADPDLKAIGKGVYGASRLWGGFVVLVVLLAFSTKVVFKDSAENPAFDVHAVLHSGAWILLAASVVLENTLRRTGKRLGQPMTRLSPEHWRFKLTNKCPKCHKFIFRVTFSKPDGTRISMWSVRRKNQPRATCSRCGQSWNIYVIS